MLSIIGQSIRQLREERGLTQEDLSAKANIDLEKLEKIENNKMIPSLGVLIRISRALGSERITLIESGEKDLSAVITRREEMKDYPTLLMDKGAKQHKNEHLSFYSLAGNKADRSMEPMIIEVAPRKLKNPSEIYSEHRGEESVYVLKGEVVLYYGKEVHHLKAGDNIYYNSEVPHFMANETDHPAKVLLTLYVPY